ncbi:FkbM family methyltransferase [Candidatus Nitrosarchaeum limnium]|uniref:Methyltransferase, FkbM family n=1 Tax=Candidatus Nitrosarchaeum limnium BG20 TaxID=859192 RepID=S2EL18_9ARCH|nr:FkbM family methyltransferase [Candidatus Nitrosarchaeum limnium]EPA05327.1 methyltransferase, FkbM family [Candidatus Nitrosarchaeum limnium BG20]
MVHQNTIRYIIKFGGPKKIIKALIFYVYDSFKKRNLDLKQSKIIQVNDYKMKIIPNDKGISSELLIYGNHEPLSTEIILNELSEGMNCLDIGSNIGYYVLLESKKVGLTGNVWAIEPSPENYSVLLDNIKLQNNKNIIAFNFAIGDKNEEIEFIISKKSNWSKIKEENDKILSEDKIIKVPLKTLDLFVEENNLRKIDLLRMDVEGFESRIIFGGLEFLRKFKPIIMIEVHKMIMGKNETKKILEKIKEINYECVFFIPRIFDVQIIGERKDIKNISINDLLKKLDNNTLPDVFQLTLKQK